MYCVKDFGSQVSLYWYYLDCRKASGVIDTTVIPEITCQAEYDAEKGFDSQGTNQIVDNIDNIVNEKFVLDPANPIKGSVHSNRFLYSVPQLHFLYQFLFRNKRKTNILFAIRFLSSRPCVRKKSTRVNVQVAEQTETVLKMDDAKETKETARFVSYCSFFLFPLQSPTLL